MIHHQRRDVVQPNKFNEGKSWNISLWDVARKRISGKVKGNSYALSKVQWLHYNDNENKRAQADKKTVSYKC